MYRVTHLDIGEILIDICIRFSKNWNTDMSYPVELVGVFFTRRKYGETGEGCEVGTPRVLGPLLAFLIRLTLLTPTRVGVSGMKIRRPAQLDTTIELRT